MGVVAHGEATVDRWNDVQAQWPDGLVPVPEKFISPLVTAQTAEFLTTVGLPTSAVLKTFTFYHDERLLTPIVHGEHTYLAFGDDLGIVPFIQIPGYNEVYDLIPPDSTPTKFVNSTLPDFIYLLGYFCAREARLLGDSPARMKAAVRQVRTALRARDQRAMSQPDHWWPRLIHQVQEGML
jgi:hypothetical protein